MVLKLSRHLPIFCFEKLESFCVGNFNGLFIIKQIKKPLLCSVLL